MANLTGMKLTGMEFSRKEYGPNKGKMEGKLTFDDDHYNQMKLVLDEEKCLQVLRLVADQLVEQTKQIAGEMAANIIHGAANPALEHKDD